MFVHGGEDLDQHQSTQRIDRIAGDRRQLGERVTLVRSVETTHAGRLDNEDRPLLGKTCTSDQGRDLALAPSPSVNDQAAVLESVKANAGASPAPGEIGKSHRPWIGKSGEFQQGASNRQRELGANAQSGVFRRRIPDANSSRGQCASAFEHVLANPGDDGLEPTG